jgi:hypothetical protein
MYNFADVQMKAAVLCILQLYIQFVSCELFLQLYIIFPCLPSFQTRHHIKCEDKPLVC